MKKTKAKLKQKIKERFHKTWFYFPLVLLMCVLQATSIFSSIELSIQDEMYQQGDRLASNIYVIGIDEDTLEKNGTFISWSRDGVADLINLLCSEEEYKPAVIALDIDYFDEGDEEKDNQLAEAIKNAGNVILTERFKIGNIPGQGDGITEYNEPIEKFKEVAYGSGFVNAKYDPEDNVIRYAYGTQTYEGVEYDSFATAIYKAYLESQGIEYEATFNAENFYICYSGGNGAYFGYGSASSSFERVMSGEYSHHAFKDAIVIVGAYEYGMQDNFYVPHVTNEQMFGCEVHANIVNQLINQTYKEELSDQADIIVVILVSLLAIAIVLLLPIRYSIITNLVLAVLYVATCGLLCQDFDLLMPILIPVLTIVMICIFYVVYSYAESVLDQQKMVDNYSKYLSPEIAKKIAHSGGEELLLGGINKNIAVLFVDIRNFTSLSETLLPEQVFEMLNKYLSVTTKAIFEYGGTVDKFIGDATMALFNAPLDLPDYEYKAVCAALKMVELADEFNKTLAPSLRGKVGFGVGVHCGVAAIGNVGTEHRMEYTAIGDTVNTASRLEGKALAGQVLISEEVYQRVKDRIECVDNGTIALKGKAKEVQSYRAIRIIEKTTQL